MTKSFHVIEDLLQNVDVKMGSYFPLGRRKSNQADYSKPVADKLNKANALILNSDIEEYLKHQEIYEKRYQKLKTQNSKIKSHTFFSNK